MSMLKTFQFRFEPDRQFPHFKRLAWDRVDVSIRDVLRGGVHPWITGPDGRDIHPSLVDAFLLRLNDAAAKPQELEPLGYSHDVSSRPGYYFEKKTRFERALEDIRGNVYFVEDLSYLELLDIAKEHLRETWDHSIARTLAERAWPGFQELRRFLKTKDKGIKLSGYADVDRYDLGRVLGLDDFDGREGLLISEAIPSLNFRKAAFLTTVTDAHGRLCLVPDIRNLTLTTAPQTPDYIHLAWHVERDKETWRFRPDIGSSEAKRRKAREFANQWRTGDGRLCFNTTLERLSEMVDSRVVVPSFPTLNYTYGLRTITAAAEVPYSRVPAYVIGGYYDHKTNAGALRDILREYGVSMTGNKAKLLQKLAGLAAKQYAARLPEMDAFFFKYRFVRINATPPASERFPLLQDAPLLRNLLLTMYALKHLRGNAVLEAVHTNNAYTEEQLARALVQGKVELNGAFLQVA